ncbi:NAD-dependent epimerase [Gammaproteobacteria bacterium]|nr:NAD-dependent epimerase [Gammaproteobacteria bacterium]
MKILVTGAAGFIGMHTSLQLLNRGDEVIGVDNLNDYYDVSLKKSRLDILNEFKNFTFIKNNIEDFSSIQALFEKHSPQKVIHLAAQAGVRYSLENPHAYIKSNIQGFMNILELCRYNHVEHLTYASSSSVYGGNESLPFSEHHSVDHPVSLYAATKKSNELMAHTYSHLFSLPTTGLRFFTVYGPWGRPDMALFLFTKAILDGNPIDVFNEGNMTRDFTYIDDIVEGVIRVSDKTATPNKAFLAEAPDPATSNAPYRVFNIGNSQPTPLMDYISAIENALNIQAKKNFLPMQLGDVQSTSADTSELNEWINFKPNTPVNEGVTNFVNWYQNFYQSK